MSNIYQYFETNLPKDLTLTAVEETDRSCSYAELIERISFWSMTIQSRGHERVAIYSSPVTSESVAQILACFRMQVPFVFVRRDEEDSRLDKILNECEVRYFIDDANLNYVTKRSNNKLDLESRNIDNKSIAYYVTTSGTTGEPKIIKGSHLGLLHFLKWFKSKYYQGTRLRVAQLTSPTFDVFLREAITPLLSQSTLVIPSVDLKKYSGTHAFSWLQDKAIDYCHVVPSVFDVWLSTQSGVRVSSLKRIFFAGEFLRPTLLSELHNTFGNTHFSNFYGPSETTLAKFYHDDETKNIDKEQSYIPVGFPLPGCEYFLSEDRVLQIHTPYSSLGYITGDCFYERDKKQWFDTKDVVALTSKNQVVVKGRSDDVVKLNGVRVNLTALENSCKLLPEICEVSAVKHSERVYLFYTGYSTVQDVISAIEDKLGKGVRPHRVQNIKDLPKLPNGKIDRMGLKGLISDSNKSKLARTSIFSILSAFTEMEPHDGSETKLSSFYLNSLDIIRFFSRLNKEFGVTIDLEAAHSDSLTLGEIEEMVIRAKANDNDLTVMHPKPVAFSITPSQKRYLNCVLPIRNKTWANMVRVIELPSDTSYDCLLHAIEILVEKHVALQTYLVGATAFSVAESTERLHDYIVSNNAADEQTIYEVVDKLRSRLIDIHSWPLFLGEHIVSKSGNHLVINVHHLICDGISMDIIKEDLLSTLEFEVTESTDFDYIKYCSDKSLEYPLQLKRGIDYWNSNLKGYSAFSCASKTSKDDTHLKYSFRIDDLPSYDRRAKLYSTKISDLVLLVYLSTVCKFFSLNDIVALVPLMGRDNYNSDMVGNFLNLVPIRLTNNENFSVEDNIRQLSSAMKLAIKHSQIQIDDICYELGFENSNESLPISDIVFSYGYLDKVTDKETQCIKISESRQEIIYSLGLFVTQLKDSLNLEIQFKKDKFEPVDIDKFVESLDNNFKAIVEV
ncbi:hypothetical protein BCT76_17985 [Vibrio tasmaniensis]|uniref:AMP-binding protein n=1 Tax=Vibrio tasmaniensis TaxID=212663 RepID=UPI000C85553A|nr:AMP-binding protein [Vibrio tasmaniensis]PML45369.1 hypothetical protein BCT76_17985 [Vibrio tasmaniensis]